MGVTWKARKKLALLLGLALALQFLPPATGSASSAYATTLLQETDGRLAYGGEWETASGDYSGGTAKVSTDANASVSFTFEGIGFKYIGEVSPHNEDLDIYIDGKKAADLKPNSGRKGPNRVLFETDDLANGTHQVTIRVDARDGKKAKRPIINIDAVEWISLPIVPEPVPDPIPEDSVTDDVYGPPPAEPDRGVTDDVYGELPSGEIVLESRTTAWNLFDTQIQTFFNIKNDTGQPVPLSELSIRYWYTKDEAVSQAFACDWAVAGCRNIDAGFVDVSAVDADTYAEISFEAGAGVIPAGGNSGVIQTRIHKSNWMPYDQSNDFSYQEPDDRFKEWDRITLYRNGQLIWGVEPQPLENPVDRLVVEYRNNDWSAKNNQIAPAFSIKNVGETAVPLHELTLRYWYTKDDDREQKFYCDWTFIGCKNVHGSFGSADTTDYLEVSFGPGAGTLARGAETQTILTRVSNARWTNYDETNDYSYLPFSLLMAPHDKITLYRNGKLVWGVEPVLRDVRELLPPQGVRADMANNAVTLTWSPVEQAAGYHIYRSVAGGEFERLTDEAISETMFVDSEFANTFLAEALTVQYQLSSADGNGKESVRSVAASSSLSASLPLSAVSVCLNSGNMANWSLHNKNEFDVAFSGVGPDKQLIIEGVVPANGQLMVEVPIGTAVEIYVQGALQTVLHSDATGCPISLLWAQATGADQVTLAFDQPVDAASASSAGNYTIDGLEGEMLTVVRAEVAPDGSTVLLTTGNQTPNRAYSITVMNVKGASQQELLRNTATFAGFAPTAPAVVVQGNLILNSSFEQYSGTEGVTDRWVKFVTEGIDHEVRVAGSPAASGARAQKLTGTDMHAGSRIMLSQEIPVEANRAFRAKGSFFVESLVLGKAQLYIDFTDGNGQWIATRTAELAEETSTFEELAVEGRVPEQAAKAMVYLILSATGEGASGSIVVDDVAFTYEPNQIMNGGFEKSDAGVVTEWQSIVPEGVDGAAEIVRHPLDSESLSYRLSGNFSHSGDRIMILQEIPVQAGKIFEAGGDLFASELTNAKVQLYIDFLDSAGNWVDTRITEQTLAAEGSQSIQIKDRVPNMAAQANVYVILQAVSSPASGTVYVDRMHFEYRANQVLNDGFEETDERGQPMRWGKIVSTSAPYELDIVSDHAANGSKSLKIAGNHLRTGERVMLHQEIPVWDGQFFEASASVHPEQLANSKVQLYLDFIDASGNWIDSRILEVTNETDAYEQIRVKDRVPKNTSSVNVYVILQATADEAYGTVFVDDVEFAYTANRILNEGFEGNVDSTGMAAHWGKIIPPDVSGDAQVIHASARSGNQALKLSGDHLGSGERMLLYQETEVPAGKRYEALAYVRTEALVDSNVLLYVDFSDTAGNWIATHAAELTDIEDGYRMINVQDLVPAEAVKATVFIILQAEADGASGTLIVDDVSFINH